MNARRPGECWDCAQLPADERPAKLRRTDQAPRKPRCATHARAERRRVRAARHETYVGRTYGLGPGDYERLLELQGGTCAIPRCRANGKRKRLAVDHDHDTGEVRGLLCGPHNYELVGKFADDLRDALAYLADPPARRLKESA